MPTLTDVFNVETSIGTKLRSTFFQPFQKNFSDVALTFTAPVSAPLFFGMLTVATAAVAVALPLASIALFAANRFFTARGAEHQITNDSNDIRSQTLAFSGFALIGGVVALVATPLLLLLTVLAAPLALVSIATRTAATIADAVQGAENSRPQHVY
ncbi:YwiC-like family protein [Legionella septentrionalis]|uniref:YwiC-like family protein n=1 Tax=Legionella septentrionalis TaxID=2498109 RepID=UPI000F8CAEC2|nr:YwiC-like family protein [Legionella septentrionalis]RUQ99324.1 hypothetical protein ELY11_04680 [Legionella septentrionalis]